MLQSDSFSINTFAEQQGIDVTKVKDCNQQPADQGQTSYVNSPQLPLKNKKENTKMTLDFVHLLNMPCTK